MATLQKRRSRGHVYWSIVESRRINGKPRPVILAYLGRAEDLLKRLTEGIPQKVKSYSHGAVAALLDLAEELEVVDLINRHLPDSSKEVRDGFTIGGSLLLSAVGRACHPTSKMNWYEGFAKHTSLSHLLKMSLVKLDSQHFWDQMEAVPVSVLPRIEEDLVSRVIEMEKVQLDTLFCDMSNFFTYIASTNKPCSLPQRGKNKQKRIDLRQLGLLLLVTRRDHLPLLHRIYQGNLQDRTIFKEHFQQMVQRFKALSGSLEQITLVFDQGNNSRATLRDVDGQIHFVGAISPCHHKEIIEKANPAMSQVSIAGKEIDCYRTRTQIWDLDLTVVVYLSEKLLEGQVRGIRQNIKKLFSALDSLREKIRLPVRQGPKRTLEALEKRIRALIASHDLEDLICWNLRELAEHTFDLTFGIDENRFKTLQENWLGRRILITNRHDWSEEEIISAYWGQAQVEYAFKTMKNPFHLAFRPQYHWTDQKIEVHGFICLLAFLLSMVLYKRAKERSGFTGCPHTLFEKLSTIRLATFIETPSQKTKGRYKAVHRIEEMEEEIHALARGLDLVDKELKTNIPFSVYN
ncbi:MAG: IS1634 family transposase [Deltaproteobacteria bacterium]|nr:MAG: IS1634 family transposase [Deltaproteobacteria bacterium]